MPGRELCVYCGELFKAGLGLKIHLSRCKARKGGAVAAVPPRAEPDPIEEFEDVPIADPLLMLKTEVEMEADRHGHDLGTWVDHPGWAEVKCDQCGLGGTAAEAPRAGVPRANFRDLVRPCK